MKNLDLARIFYEISEYLEMKEIPFKPRSYRNVARVLESLEEDVEEVYRKEGLKGLENIPGVGESIAGKIEEFIKTGKIRYYEKLKKSVPVDLTELTKIEGLGPKMIKSLYENLKIKNVKGLEKAARAGKLRNLSGFGEKRETNILESITFFKKSKGRFLLGTILPRVREIIARLETFKEIEEISPAGSVRRMNETIGDIDILATSSSPGKLVEFFISLPGVVKVWDKGLTKSSVHLKDGFDVDLRIVEKESYGAALQYFTGSKDHNIATRKIAIEKGLKLNEYGVFRKGKKIAGRTEKEVYEAIGLPYIEPELRENRGEIEAALKEKLPALIGYKDIKGDLQVHTTWSDGAKEIREMALAAKKMGYKYIAITDHTGELRIAGGMDRAKIVRQMAEIDKINKSLSGIKVLRGCEVNIKKDGSLDMDSETLAKLDIVLASVHSNFKLSKKEMTERLCRAMENSNVDIIVHPTGRKIQSRRPYELDLEKIFKKAKETRTVLEINAFPERLDLNDVNTKEAIEAGVKIEISTDTHDKSHLHFMELGIAVARRGWAEKKDIINTRPLEQMLNFLKS